MAKEWIVPSIGGLRGIEVWVLLRLVGEELVARIGPVVTPGTADGGVVEKLAPANRGRIDRRPAGAHVRISDELADGIDVVRHVIQASAESPVGLAEIRVDVHGFGGAGPHDESAEALEGIVLHAFAIARAHQRTEGIFEVLDLVPVAVPVNRPHGIEVALAVGGDRGVVVGHEARIGPAGSQRRARAAIRVGHALGTGIVCAAPRGEGRPSDQSHRISQARTKLGEVPAATVETGFWVTRRAGDVGCVVRQVDDLPGGLEHVCAIMVVGRNRVPETEVVRYAGVARRGGEEDLAVQNLGRHRIARGARDDGFDHDLTLPARTVGIVLATGAGRAQTRKRRRVDHGYVSR